MNSMAFLAAAACTVLIAPSAAPGAVLLEDSFTNDGPRSDTVPAWVVYSGKWRVTDEAYEGVDCEGGFAAMGARSGRKQWKDYTLSLRLKVISRGSDWRDGPWLGVRCRDSANVYTVGFYDRIAVLHKASSGKFTGDENPLAQSSTTINDNEWHDVSVTVEGHQINVRLDGSTILEASDDNWNGAPPIESGGVVLSARKWENAEGATRVLFDDVRVEALAGVRDSLKLRLPSPAPREVTMLDFIRSRRDRRYARVPRQVLAFYYTWYGTPERHGRWVHWHAVKPDEHDIASSTHYPAKGAYDSHDPEIIDWHIDLAKSHGLTGFICTWWGQGTFDDTAFATVLERAASKEFKVTVYWETAPGKGPAQIDQAVSDLLYILNRYGSHPAFLELDGSPVIFVYGRVMGQVPLNAWPAIIRGVRSDYPHDFLLVADGYQESFARLFDGVHTYNICGWVKGKTPDELREAAAQSFETAVKLAKSQGKVSCITIIPGYDDTKIRTPGLNAERRDGETYRVLWEQAIKADPDWVLITSWNEWHEGSEIEPSFEHGDTYVTMTQKYAAQFRATPHSKLEPTERPAGLDPVKAGLLRELYRGKTIGILPDFGGQAVFWLADTGIGLKELTWAGLLDPAVFNAQDIPLVLHAGDERFVQSLNEERDVERALQGYLSEGGFLMAIPFRPFPFYYNEDGDQVSAARRLGFPIAGSGAGERDDVPEGARVAGWETPPAGVLLTFHIDTQALPGVPEAAPFPTTGDLRWRPATRGLTAKDDGYLPLAQLRDADGNSYGDGIVYLEHKTPTLGIGNGKTLYVWMRMPEALGMNDALFALFRFAGEKLR